MSHSFRHRRFFELKEAISHISKKYSIWPMELAVRVFDRCLTKEQKSCAAPHPTHKHRSQILLLFVDQDVAVGQKSKLETTPKTPNHGKVRLNHVEPFGLCSKPQGKPWALPLSSTVELLNFKDNWALPRCSSTGVALSGPAPSCTGSPVQQENPGLASAGRRAWSKARWKTNPNTKQRPVPST